MSDELDRLWALHALDEAAIAVEQRLRQRPLERAEWERRIQAERHTLDAHRAAGLELQKKRRELEKDIDALNTEERRFQGQLPAVKKNEEYTALLHEIEGVKRRRSDLETDVLTRMEEEEAAGRARPALEKSLAAVEAERAQRFERMSSEETADRDELAGIEKRRAAELEKLPAATRSRYERVRQSREGRAVVAVIKNACGGCYRSLPPQVLQEARRRDRVLVCEGCGRLLVWPPDPA
ncbi:MAG TPA: C4-type zinc ribbon domain-containing protein [Candidatus Udaeobacter sp.]|jgi:predicted  nucleic acid-binding Zn-ribbon protein|nr:C4-type zinc ribbon domain-containing protein [Candidatus Udaeobacter sp.]